MRLESRMADGGGIVGGAFLRLAAADELRIGRLAEDDPGLGPFPSQDATDPTTVPPVP